MAGAFPGKPEDFAMRIVTHLACDERSTALLQFAPVSACAATELRRPEQTSSESLLAPYAGDLGPRGPEAAEFDDRSD